MGAMGLGPRKPTTERALATRIKRLVAKYKKWMGLDDWDITVVFRDHNTDTDGIANCTAEPEYRRAVLSFDLKKVMVESHADPDLDYLPRLVRHEAAHVGLWKLATMAEEHVPKKMKSYALAEHEACATWLETWPLWKVVER